MPKKNIHPIYTIRLIWCALAFCLTATGLLAQSTYGCTNLENANPRIYEGIDGTFFRLEPDLQNSNRLPDAVVADIAKLSQALAQRGTTLTLLPLPTKALSMPYALGSGATKFGYDPNLAARLYADNLNRLSAAGVATIDLRKSLISIDAPFQKTDPRLSPNGVAAIASAITNTPLPAAKHNTSQATANLAGLQGNCLLPLPKPQFETYESNSTGIENVYVGSTLTTDPLLNLQTLLGFNAVWSAESHLDGIQGYLTSNSFQSNPPEHLYWELPVWANLTAHGDQPLRELIAAAVNSCTKLRTQLVEDTLVAGLGQADSDLSVMLDLGPNTATSAKFTFSNSEKHKRARHVQRAKGRETNRFYVPLTGLWTESNTALTVRSSGDMTQSTLWLCRG